jgi:signal transduction histidine kinase
MFGQEVVVTLPTGRRAFDFSMRPVLSAAGEVIAIVPEAIELTEGRAAEERLRQARRRWRPWVSSRGDWPRLQQSAHRHARQPGLLKMRIAQGRPDDAERYIVAAERAASRAAALTHGLRAFSRQQMLTPKTTAANTLVSGMEERVRRTVGPQIRVETVLATDLWQTWCDPNQLESAILNLCANARDAMPERGDLTIETANAELNEQEARTRDMTVGGYVSICVTDTGTGMTPEGGGGACIRPVLHHQAARHGHGARPVHDPRVCQAVRRPGCRDRDAALPSPAWENCRRRSCR